MNKARNVFTGTACWLLLAMLFPIALPAQEQDEASLRQWYQSLPAARRAQLRHRQRVYNRMPPPRKLEVLDAAREGKPLLTEEERASLRRVRAMRGPERMRLLTLSHELQLIRRIHGPEFEAAMQLDGTERVQRLQELLRRHRAREFMRRMPPEQRERLQELAPPERNRELVRLFIQESRERREALLDVFPHINELRAGAREGDEAARAELRRAMADIRTLDMMLQRLQLNARKLVQEQLPGLNVEEAFELLRRELRQQARTEARNRPRRPEPHEQHRRESDNTRPAEERRHKGPPRDRR